MSAPYYRRPRLTDLTRVSAGETSRTIFRLLFLFKEEKSSILTLFARREVNVLTRDNGMTLSTLEPEISSLVKFGNCDSGFKLLTIVC